MLFAVSTTTDSLKVSVYCSKPAGTSLSLT